MTAGSPCIDAGSVWLSARDGTDADGDGCFAERAPLDLDGNNRFHDDASTPNTGLSSYWFEMIDIGVYEYGADANNPVSPCTGDLNCDGLANNGDIDAFVLALTDPSAYVQLFPDCDHMHGDTNEDGLINNGDIDYLVVLLGG